MEDKDSRISELQGEIRARNKELHLAAIYGKQLLEEQILLKSKINSLVSEKENLEQEKHSLQLTLEGQLENVKSQASELELQKSQIDDLNEKFRIVEKKNETLQKKVDSIATENEYFKTALKEKDLENKILLDKINLLEKQIKNFEDQAEKSMCEIEKDESIELQAHLNTYMLNNKELQETLSKCQYELEVTKKNENQLLQMAHEYEEAIDEKSSEISAYQAELKKAKEIIEEHQEEIEVYKLNQLDVNRRGNSVFAELDDRRHMVEREYKILRKKYDQFQKDYEENMKELDRSRGQIAILQSKVSRDYQQTYIDSLENSLSSARLEINDLMHKLSRAVKNNAETIRKEDFSETNEYDYLRAMLNQLRRREKELQSEVVTLASKNMYDNDKLVETQHLLFRSKADLDTAKQEIVKLKLKVKELEQGIMHKLPKEPQASKPRIEIFEGFKPLSKSKENEMLNKSKLNLLDDRDIVPGELELGEDGFHEVRRPRKSNKFILQEFNRIKPDDEETVDISNSTSKKTELVETKSEIVKVTHEIGKVELRSHSKGKSKDKLKRQNDNCAQQ